MGFSLKLLRNKEDADELTQDTFVRLWENRAKLDPNKSIEAFLFVMVRSSFLDSLKKNKQHANYIAAQECREPAISLTEEYMDYTECKELLNCAVRNLPQQAQLVYTLSRVDGLTHKEIAKHLGISPFTVSNHLKYALKQLKVYFKKMSPETSTLCLLAIFLYFH